MAFDPRAITLAAYKPYEFQVSCRTCNRSAVVSGHRLGLRFGRDTSLQEAARQLAASKGCERAAAYGGSGTNCAVIVEEVPVWFWAKLSHAVEGRWQASVTCQRSMAAMKPTKSCPEVTWLDIPTMVVLLGTDYPLERIVRKGHCPHCGTNRVEITWHTEAPQARASTKEAAAVTIEALRSGEEAKRRQDRLQRIADGGQR
jgi:hypothetical protein